MVYVHCTLYTVPKCTMHLPKNKNALENIKIKITWISFLSFSTFTQNHIWFCGRFLSGIWSWYWILPHSSSKAPPSPTENVWHYISLTSHIVCKSCWLYYTAPFLSHRFIRTLFYGRMETGAQITHPLVPGRCCLYNKTGNNLWPFSLPPI